MVFSTAPSYDALATFCRMTRHGLQAGLSLVDVFRQQARRAPLALRPTVERIGSRLETGDALEDALQAEASNLPHLFVSMAVVGEQTGNMPEVFGELERYYALQSRLRKQFLAEITWPIIQFIAATFVLSAMILILGLIAPSPGQAFDPLGFGTGPMAAATFFFGIWGTVLAVFIGYKMLSHASKQKAAVDRILLRVPALGPCLEALALGRFCLALRLTMGAGLKVRPSLKRSLDATGNAAYPATYERAAEVLRRGDDLHTSLEACQIFPHDFLNIVASAEEGGRVPEAMEQQADYYAEESSRRMATLTKVAGFGVWLLVAIILIFAIFRIALTYIGMIDKAASGNLNF